MVKWSQKTFSLWKLHFSFWIWKHLTPTIFPMDTKFYQEVFSKHRVNSNALLYREFSVPQLHNARCCRPCVLYSPENYLHNKLFFLVEMLFFYQCASACIYLCIVCFITLFVAYLVLMFIYLKPKNMAIENVSHYNIGNNNHCLAMSWLW